MTTIVATIRDTSGTLLRKQSRTITCRSKQKTITLSSVLSIRTSPIGSTQSLSTKTNIGLTIYKRPITCAVCDNPFVCGLSSACALPWSFRITSYAFPVPCRSRFSISLRISTLQRSAPLIGALVIRVSLTIIPLSTLRSAFSSLVCISGCRTTYTSFIKPSLWQTLLFQRLSFPTSVCLFPSAWRIATAKSFLLSILIFSISRCARCRVSL